MSDRQYTMPPPRRLCAAVAWCHHCTRTVATFSFDNKTASILLNKIAKRCWNTRLVYIAWQCGECAVGASCTGVLIR